MEYPMLVLTALLIVGMLVENYVRTRFNASHMPGG